MTGARKAMAHERVKTVPVPEEGPVFRNQIIGLASGKTMQGELTKMRRAEIRETGTGKVYVFMNNYRRWAAQAVADLYTSRWEAQLLFESTKQNLQIRTFVGHGVNPVASQIFLALCVYLLVAFQMLLSRSSMAIRAIVWSSSTCSRVALWRTRFTLEHRAHATRGNRCH